MVYKIDSYSFGRMKVDGTLYKNDIIIGPEALKSDWWRKEGHYLHKEDLKFVLTKKPDKLIIGTGASGRMSVPKDLIEELKNENNLKVIVKPTAKAIKDFNRSMDNKENAFGAFHLTC